jgi:hypothetical protein
VRNNFPMTHNDSQSDWLNLPAGVESQSLWVALHDGELIAIRSNVLKRILTLEVDAYHLRERFRWDDETRIVIELEKVESVRASAWVIWPGDAPDIKTLSLTEQERLITEYQEKWREESLEWNRFEAAFSTNKLDITDAYFAKQNQKIALRIQGFMDGDVFNDQFVTVFVRAQTIRFSLSDGPILTAEQLLDLGSEYWKDFAAINEGTSPNDVSN